MAAFQEQNPGYEPAGEDAEYELHCTFYCGTKRKKDLDNMLKLVQDALNKHAYHDDSQIMKLVVEQVRGVGTANALMVVELYRRVVASDLEAGT